MRSRLLLVALAAGSLALSSPVLAQTNPAGTANPTGQSGQVQRPFRGLFGGGVSDTGQGLIFTASLAGGYDYDQIQVQPVAGFPSGGSTQRDHQFASGSANVRYSIDRAKVVANLGASARARYFPGAASHLVSAYSAMADLSVQLSTSTRLSTSNSAALQPHNVGTLFGANVTGTRPFLPPDVTLLMSVRTYRTVSSGIAISQRLTSRLSANVSYAYYGNNAWATTNNGLYFSQTGKAGVSYSLAKGIGFHLGYGFTRSGFGTQVSGIPYRGSTIDGGINFNRALSLTRRTTVSFATGVSGIARENLTTRYYFTGSANLVHEIGRSWTLGGGYHRSVNFDQVLAQPVLMDVVQVGVGGEIGRRVQASANVGLVKGTAGINSNPSGYTAASAGAGLQFALGRMLSLGVNYSFYRYEFDDISVLPPGVLSRLNRHSVGVSLNLWAPLVTLSRRN